MTENFWIKLIFIAVILYTIAFWVMFVWFITKPFQADAEVKPYGKPWIVKCSFYESHCGEYATQIIVNRGWKDFFPTLGDTIWELNLKGFTQSQIERIVR